MTEVQTPSRVRWRIIALIFLVYVLMFFDRVNISIAAKFIMPEYHLTQIEFGVIFSAFLLAYALAQIPGGWLGDRFGPRKVMAWAIVWWSAFTALTALAGDGYLASLLGVVGSFALVRALIGIGEAAAPPNGNRMVANWSARGERGLAAGLTLSGTSIGAALTPPLVVWVMTHYGWRDAFYGAGAAGLVVAVIWVWLTTDSPDQHARVNAAERALIAHGQLNDDVARIPGQVPWRKLFGSRDLWCLAAAYGVLGYNVYFYFAWFYLYLVDVRHFTLERGGLFTMAPFLTMAVAAPLGGWLSDAVGRRYSARWSRSGIGAVTMLLTSLLVASGAATDNAVWSVVLLSASTGTLVLSVAAFWATTIDLAYRYAGTASAVMNMGGNLGGAVSPTLTPYLGQTYGWHVALYVMSALSLLGALLWLCIDPRRAIDFDAPAAQPLPAAA